MSSFLSKVIDSSATPALSRSGRRVSDARGRLATYATLAEALHSNGIDYSLDDYRIWSANIPLDDHGRNSNTFIQVYGDGFEGYADEDEAMDALRVFYDDNGREAFYDSINITSLCVRVHDGENKPLLEWYIDSTSLRSSFVVDIIDAIGFCSEEHMSVAEFFDYMSKFVKLATNYFIDEEEFKQKYLVYDSKVVSDDAKIVGKCTPRRTQDSEDLDGWEEVYNSSLRVPTYVKEYGDNIPNIKIVDFTKFGKPAEFRIHTRLLKALGFDELADILYFAKFDSFSEAAGVADRIAAAHDAYYKSLSDIIGE